jgi:phosphoglycerate dehydrogenase-like enzyme
MPASEEEWLDRTKGADIICSGKFGLKKYIYELENIFISLPFVAFDWVDQAKAKERNIVIKNSPGCNKDPVAEWIVAMTLNLMRKFPKFINTKDKIDWDNPNSESLSIAGKKACIVGSGNIGLRVGEIFKAMGVDLSYFKRGDNLIKKVKDADIVVDTIAANSETKNIYNKEFFNSLKKGSYFITVTGEKLWDADAMIDALDKDILAGVATDCGSLQVGTINDPLYKKLSSHPKIYATPHIAFDSDRRDFVCNNMMIDNIEEYLKNS